HKMNNLMNSRAVLNCLQQGSKQIVRKSHYALSTIGNRDIVGSGYNNTSTYVDRTDFPMPAIRFKANTPDVLALREKEKGDWKKLSIDEKKALYRASFRSTFAEIDAPTGEWKIAIGYGLVIACCAVWYYMFYKLYVLPPLPPSFEEENQLAMLDRIIKLDMNPITGFTAKYNK
ncbi:hypothetical protein V1478_009636, partial [Vespula squamosa]